MIQRLQLAGPSWLVPANIGHGLFFSRTVQEVIAEE
jgi:hypothetical protein